MPLIPRNLGGFPSPLDPTGPLDDVGKAANDLLRADEKVRASELLRRNGWGTKNTRGNKRARGVMKCESNFEIDAYNDTPCAAGENAVGLMQVCTVHRGKMGIPQDKAKAVKYLEDPDNNVKVARAIYKSQGWGAWACPVVETNEDPEITVSKNNATDLVADVTDPLLAPLDAIAQFFGLLTQADTWLRIGKIGLGLFLLSAGVVALIAAGGKTVGKSKVGKAAISAVPVGKAATVAKGAVGA